MQAVILAGGKGTRLRSVVNDRPKPMVEVAGKPFLFHLLEYWVEQGVDCFILSVGYMKDKIIESVGSSFEGVPITFVEENAPLGTGGALLHVFNRNTKTEENVIVMNGDTLFRVDVSKMWVVHDKYAATITLAVRQVPMNTRYHGIRIDEESRVIGIDEQGGQGTSTLVNGGVYIINRSLMSLLYQDSGHFVSLENYMFPNLISDGKMYSFVADGFFIDIGIPEDLVAADRLLAQ